MEVAGVILYPPGFYFLMSAVILNDVMMSFCLVMHRMRCIMPVRYGGALSVDYDTRGLRVFRTFDKRFYGVVFLGP